MASVKPLRAGMAELPACSLKKRFETVSCRIGACRGPDRGVRLIKRRAYGEVYAYSYGAVRDYLTVPYEANAVDWVITNPPFRLAEEFVTRSLIVARKGVAILGRTVFLESVGRYRSLFEWQPPSRFAQYTERVAMVKGRLDKKASTATGYAWLVWEKDRNVTPRLMWVPPCRKDLEREGDYA